MRQKAWSAAGSGARSDGPSPFSGVTRPPGGGRAYLASAAKELAAEEANRLYDASKDETRALMQKKNHDYGEAWRDMRISSLTDLILMKVLRVKQIENNDGKTVASEGVEANYMDMANYALFALILSSEQGSN